MKKSVKLFSLVMAGTILATLLCGCGKSDRILYNSVRLKSYVTLGEYAKLPVDTSSDTFKEYYKDEVISDAKNNDLYDELSIGSVEDGDTVNIDYEGKMDGVAFEKGTQTGDELEIGSHSFINGFEEGLIGVAIGKTTVLNLTFPEDYSDKEFAGKPVVFTVKVNSIKRPKSANQIYTDMGYKTFNAYDSSLTKRAINQYLLDTVMANSKIKKYPEKDYQFLFDSELELIKTNVQSQNGVDLATYLSSINMDEESFEETLKTNQIEPMMDQQMVIYLIADKEGISYTKTELTKLATDYAKRYGDDVSADDVKNFYGEYYFESMLLTEKVQKFLYDSAKIK